VVIPAYNSEAYLVEAIDSVLGQTYGDVEVIVVDDGSTDGTGELIRSRYPMTRYIRTENGGPARARNIGIRNAGGEFVAFLDADDVWLPRKLEKQMTHFYRDPDVAMIFTENNYFDDRGVIDYSRKFDKRVLMRGCVPANIFLHSYVVTSTVIVRKKVFDDVGYFDEGLTIAEDDNLWIRISSKYKIHLVEEILMSMRRNHGSLTSDIVAIIRGVEKNIELLREKYKCFDESMEPIIDKKYSILHNSMGYYHFKRDEFKSARIEYAKSIRHDPVNLNSYRYLFLSFLPPVLINAIKRCKRMRNCRNLSPGPQIPGGVEQVHHLDDGAARSQGSR
jgi:glycosyltransferase involved in cell wall biosynthesis